MQSVGGHILSVPNMAMTIALHISARNASKYNKDLRSLVFLHYTHCTYCTPEIFNTDVIKQHQQCTLVSSGVKQRDSAVGALFDRGHWSTDQIRL